MGTSGTFTFQGARLHYRRSGRGRPLVLVHGLSGSGEWWRHNVKALSEGHAVYLIDLTGYGSARRQRSLGVRAAAELVAAWLRAEDLQDVTLIGHSMGGHIVMHVAALEPGRVSGMVLACASGLLRGNVYHSAMNLPKAAMVGQKRFLPRIMFDALRAGPLNLWLSTSDLLKDSVQDLLPQITVPTLVVWGERDVLVPLALGQLLAQTLPDARLEVIPRAGHVVMVDAAPRFNALVLEFLQAVQSSNPPQPRGGQSSPL